jgi:hypothetical protein
VTSTPVPSRTVELMRVRTGWSGRSLLALAPSKLLARPGIIKEQGAAATRNEQSKLDKGSLKDHHKANDLRSVSSLSSAPASRSEKVHKEWLLFETKESAFPGPSYSPCLSSHGRWPWFCSCLSRLLRDVFTTGMLLGRLPMVYRVVARSASAVSDDTLTNERNQIARRQHISNTGKSSSGKRMPRLRRHSVNVGRTTSRYPRPLSALLREAHAHYLLHTKRVSKVQLRDWRLRSMRW